MIESDVRAADREALVISEVPSPLEDYEPLDMRENLWAATNGKDFLGDTAMEWRFASSSEGDIRALLNAWPQLAFLTIGQFPLHELLAPSPVPSFRGVAVIAGNCVLRYIEAKPGER